MALGYQARLEMLKTTIDETVHDAGKTGVPKRLLYLKAWELYTLGRKTVDRCINYREQLGTMRVLDHNAGEQSIVQSTLETKK